MQKRVIPARTSTLPRSNAENMMIAKPYLENPLGPVGIRKETRLQTVCLHCGSHGESAYSTWTENEFLCLSCRERFMDEDVKYHEWFSSYYSNYNKCHARVDSRDPELNRCSCAALICADCGACKASCPTR